jgi:hypothetical protein
MYMNKLRVLKKLDTLFYTVSFVSFFPDHNAQPEELFFIQPIPINLISISLSSRHITLDMN